MSEATLLHFTRRVPAAHTVPDERAAVPENDESPLRRAVGTPLLMIDEPMRRLVRVARDHGASSAEVYLALFGGRN